MLNIKEHPIKRFFGVTTRGLIKFLSKKLYVKMQYRYITHHPLNLKNPTRYTEKLQTFRLHPFPNHDLVTQLADRAGARPYLESHGLGEHLIRTYGVYEKYEDIPFVQLPQQFVLKCTHASGFNKIILNKDNIDHLALAKQFKKWLKTDYGKKTVEPHYSKIKPQIIVEEYMQEDHHLPTEYKIHVFNGQARYLYVVSGRGQDIRYDNFYADGTPFDAAQFNGWKKSDQPFVLPPQLQEMIKLSEQIAKDVVFCRVDLFLINRKIYFNECTFLPAKGTLIFDDDQADFIIGDWLKIT